MYELHSDKMKRKKSQRDSRISDLVIIKIENRKQLHNKRKPAALLFVGKKYSYEGRR